MKSNVLDTGSDRLILFSDAGMAHHTAPPMSYDDDYWEYYREIDPTEMGEALTRARVDFVNKHWGGPVVDIGIGGGNFVDGYGALGFDVNVKAIEWLEKRGLFVDPYKERVDVLCFWDSLEHIPDPVSIVERAQQLVFVSMPIYETLDSIKDSKHYKPGEHLWYWTHEGLLNWFSDLGFRLLEFTDVESTLGREGIMSYAFARTGA